MQFNLKDATAEELRLLWDNSGKYGPGPDEKITVKDALSVPNNPALMPKVVTSIVREAQEPLLVATSLLQRINYSYGGQVVTFPAVGALVAAEIPENGEYPERSLNLGGATVTASIGKHGVAVRITEEMIRYSQFDVIGMHLRAAGRALARHKEQLCFNYIRSMGTTVFDNLTPGNAILGVTTGRDLLGAPNGSVTMDDVFDAYAQVMTAGFTPNTLLMHPLTWGMFIKDATLRSFVQANGGGAMFGGWTGQAAVQNFAGQGTNMGLAPGQKILPAQTATGAAAPHGQTASTLLEYPQTLSTAPQMPSYLNVPFRIIVSPYVPFEPRRKLTDIYMFDSNELGVLIVDEELMTEEFDDPRVDVKKIKFRERYAIGILNEGQAIAVMRNVHCVPNEVAMGASVPTISISGDIQKIAPNTVLGL